MAILASLSNIVKDFDIEILQKVKSQNFNKYFDIKILDYNKFIKDFSIEINEILYQEKTNFVIDFDIDLRTNFINTEKYFDIKIDDVLISNDFIKEFNIYIDYTNVNFEKDFIIVIDEYFYSESNFYKDFDILIYDNGTNFIKDFDINILDFTSSNFYKEFDVIINYSNNLSFQQDFDIEIFSDDTIKTKNLIKDFDIIVNSSQNFQKDFDILINTGYYTQKNFIKEFDIKFEEIDYNILVNPTSITFSDAFVNYTTTPSQTVTITNVGEWSLLNLTATLKHNINYQIIAGLLKNSLDGNESVNIVIQPKLGLPLGLYLDELIITNDKYVNITIPISFVVKINQDLGNNYTPESLPNYLLLTKNDTYTVSNYSGMNYIILGPGKYKFECYGAKGGPSNGGGNGAYTSGIIELTNRQDFTLFTGDSTSGFNSTTSSVGNGSYGGAASDIRRGYWLGKNWYDRISLANRIMVAGGGGGNGYRQTNTRTWTYSLYSTSQQNIGTTANPIWTTYYTFRPNSSTASGSVIAVGTGGAAGLIGSDGSSITNVYTGTGGSGGQQDKNGANGTVSNQWYTNSAVGGGGPGGGYYPGNGGISISTTWPSSPGNISNYTGSIPGGRTDTQYIAVGCGGGGSSYISGYSSCNSITSDYANNLNTLPFHNNQNIHYSGLYFTSTQITDAISTGKGQIKITCLERYADEDSFEGEIQYSTSQTGRKVLMVISKLISHDSFIVKRIIPKFLPILLDFLYVNYKEHNDSKDMSINEYSGYILDQDRIYFRSEHEFKNILNIFDFIKKRNPHLYKKIFNILKLAILSRMPHLYSQSKMNITSKILKFIYKRRGVINKPSFAREKLAERNGVFNLYTSIANKIPYIKIKILTFLLKANRSSKIQKGKIISILRIFTTKIKLGLILAYKGIQDILQILQKILPPRSFPLEVAWNRKPSVDNPWGGRVLNGIVVCDKIQSSSDSNIPRAQPLSFAWTKQK